MRRRIVYALLAVAGVLVLGSLAGYAFLALGFGSPAEWTLEAERLPADRVAEAATADLSAREARAATRAIENGSAETVGYTLDLNGSYVERNGTYYRLSTGPGGERTVTRPVASFAAANDTDGTAVAAESLPDPDRKAVALAYRAHRIRQREGCANRSCPPMEYVYELPRAAEASAIVGGEVEYVRFRNVTFRTTVRERNVTTQVSRYTAEPVAANESALRRLVVRDLSLSGEAAALLETAVEDGSVTVTSRDRDEARAAALDRVLSAAGMPERSEVLWRTEAATAIVRYEGSYYRLRLTGRGGGP